MAHSEHLTALVEVVTQAASDKLASNPVLVEVGERLALADAFFITSAPTERQVRAVAENIMDEVSRIHSLHPERIEGRTEGRWVLLDYGDLVVHIMIDEDREYYALEKLWGDVPVVHLEPDMSNSA